MTMHQIEAELMDREQRQNAEKQRREMAWLNVAMAASWLSAGKAVEQRYRGTDPWEPVNPAFLEVGYEYREKPPEPPKPRRWEAWVTPSGKLSNAPTDPGVEAKYKSAGWTRVTVEEVTVEEVIK